MRHISLHRSSSALRRPIVAFLFVVVLLSATATATAEDAEGPVARVGGVEVTLEELEASVATQLEQLDKQRATLLEEALPRLVESKLIEVAAKAKGISSDELLQAEVIGKAREVTETDIDIWYQQNRGRLGQRTKEELAGQIRSYLKSQREGEHRQTLLASLRADHEVEILLEPQRTELDLTTATWKGPEDAAVTLVEFSDFQCPACKGFNPILDQLMATYPEDVRVAFLQLPLLSIHPLAQDAAEAALCARDEGKFWEMHDQMFLDQKKLGIEDLKASARAIGLDGAAFDECLDSNRYEATVQQDLAQASRLGANGTPTVYINGREVSPGRVPSLSAMSRLVDDELARVAGD